jgi:hypothetical protein
MKEKKPKQPKEPKPERERKYTFSVIPTKYKGWNFRSRLECRWALFFDGMDIQYTYEPEGVLLWRGGVYLPDFYLPIQKAYVEVKPDAFTEEELKKCRMLCRMSESLVILCDGAPEPITYNCYYHDDKHACETDIVLFSQATVTENRFYMGTGFEQRTDAHALLTEKGERALFMSRSFFM